MGSNWGFVFIRLALFAVLLLLLYLSQRFWVAGGLRLAGRVRRPVLRRFLRSAIYLAIVAVCVAAIGGIIGLRAHMFARGSLLAAAAGLWLSSAFLAYVAVKLVAVAEWVWLWLASRWKRLSPSAAAHRKVGAELPPASQPSAPAALELADPSRRYFFKTASYLAGAIPFVGAVYGFAAERLRYQIGRIEVPIPGLPAALDGLRIAQLSDIHCGGYMPVAQVRRAVEMANELGADLAVVTGDFITGATDPLEACVEELARLRAPLGVWGCNGNHEIYADVEDYAAHLFRQAGMRILRRENVELAWRAQPFNLIGVDYQRSRTSSGGRVPMLHRVEPLVRRDVPNILLSHNPNAFLRAAELGIELTLAGHTHGGQVQVEILDSRWNPARFITPFIAGLYQLPLGLPASVRNATAAPGPNPDVAARHNSSLQRRASCLLYVNRGLGTVGAPVRIGVPPEITLLTLRRA